MPSPSHALLPPHSFPHRSTDRAFLRKWAWSQVVMDEAHALKNAASSRARRLRRLAQARLTGGLTGA
jgi:SWI/SNF-related matrix-associated actin-dependent regulator 1 of chromatin subfamily A